MTKGILFNTEMVKAILEGRKTVTRRIIKPTSKDADRVGILINDITKTTTGAINCSKDGSAISGIKPPYQIGQILYVRETWRYSKFHGNEQGYMYRASCKENWDGFWKPSIHMPKEAARIWLKVTNVRVERLQDITQEDVRKEGCVDDCCMCSFNNKYEEHEIDCSKGIKKIKDCDLSNMFPKTGFRNLWDSTIKKQDLDKYGWNANPYVWVIEFERIEKGDI